MYVTLYVTHGHCTCAERPFFDVSKSDTKGLFPVRQRMSSFSTL